MTFAEYFLPNFLAGMLVNFEIAAIALVIGLALGLCWRRDGWAVASVAVRRNHLADAGGADLCRHVLSAEHHSARRHSLRRAFRAPAS